MKKKEELTETDYEAMVAVSVASCPKLLCHDFDDVDREFYTDSIGGE